MKGVDSKIDIAENYLIDTVKLHKNTINLIQNENVVFVKEQSPEEWREKTFGFFALLFAKFEKIQKI